MDQHFNNAKSGPHPLHAPGPCLEDVNDVAEVDKYHLCGIIHQALRMVDGEVNGKFTEIKKPAHLTDAPSSRELVDPRYYWCTLAFSKRDNRRGE